MEFHKFGKHSPWCRSDYELLISKFKPKLKTKKKTYKLAVFDLDNIIEDYRVKTCNQFQMLMHEELEKVEPNCLWEDIKHAIMTQAHDNVPKKQITKTSPWLSSTAINIAQGR